MFWPLEHAFFSIPLALVLAGTTAVVLAAALRAGRALSLWISGIALAVPWLVGLAVKVWLMVEGQSTWPVAWFLRELPILVPVAVLMAMPLMAYSLWARHALGGRPSLGLPSRAARGCCVAGVVVGSVASMALAFTELFWQFDPEVFLAMPMIWLQYLPGAVVGGLAGWMIGKLRGSATPPG